MTSHEERAREWLDSEPHYVEEAAKSLAAEFAAVEAEVEAACVGHADAAVGALEKRVAVLEAALKSVEWSGRVGREGEYNACPSCDSISPNDPDFGGGDHLPGCALSTALSGEPTALLKMLEWAAYMAFRRRPPMSTFVQSPAQEAADIAKRVWEGR